MLVTVNYFAGRLNITTKGDLDLTINGRNQNPNVSKRMYINRLKIKCFPYNSKELVYRMQSIECIPIEYRSIKGSL